VVDRQQDGRLVMLMVGMVLLGLATFLAMYAFISLCDRV
jgi:hypothetical protein